MDCEGCKRVHLPPFCGIDISLIFCIHLPFVTIPTVSALCHADSEPELVLW